MGRCVGEWMDGWMDGWMSGKMSGQVREWMHGLVADWPRSNYSSKEFSKSLKCEALAPPRGQSL